MKELHPKTKYLERLICSGFRTKISEDIVFESFPHYERPNLMEMEYAINCALDGKAIPKSIEMKLEIKPTNEMLQEFCSRRNLHFYLDPKERCYVFQFKGWMKENEEESCSST